VEPIQASGTTQKLHIEISGTVTYSYDTSHITYKSLDNPIPERSQPCLEGVKSYLSPGRQGGSDDFWTGAAAAARALVKR
jgi:hypothetical protein